MYRVWSGTDSSNIFQGLDPYQMTNVGHIWMESLQQITLGIQPRFLAQHSNREINSSTWDSSTTPSHEGIFMVSLHSWTHSECIYETSHFTVPTASFREFKSDTQRFRYLSTNPFSQESSTVGWRSAIYRVMPLQCNPAVLAWFCLVPWRQDCLQSSSFQSMYQSMVAESEDLPPLWVIQRPIFHL